MKKIAIFIPVLLHGIAAFCQQRGHGSAYIVTHSHDTIWGNITLHGKPWVDSVFFDPVGWHPALGLPLHIKPAAWMLKPEDIEAFGEAKGKKEYKAADLCIDQRPIDPEQATPDSNFVGVQQRVFLKRLLSGKKLALYLYQDKKREHFFIQDATGSWQELICFVYREPKTVWTYLAFRAQLDHYIFNITPELYYWLNATPYEKRALCRLVKQINHKPDYPNIPTIKVNPYIMCWETFDMPSRYFEDGGYSAEVSYDNGRILPNLAAGVELSHDYWMPRLFLRAGIAYEESEYNVEYRKTPTDERRTYWFREHLLVPGLALLYKRNLKGYVQLYAGAGLGYPIGWTKRMYDGAGFYDQPVKNNFKISYAPLYANFSAGAIFVRHFEVNIRYSTRKVSGLNPTFTINKSTWSAGVVYLFKW